MIFHQQNKEAACKILKAWLLLEAQKPRRGEMLLNIASGFTGMLHDWWQSLEEYHQLQFLQDASIDGAINHLYIEFCGQEAQITERLQA